MTNPGRVLEKIEKIRVEIAMFAIKFTALFVK